MSHLGKIYDLYAIISTLKAYSLLRVKNMKIIRKIKRVFPAFGILIFGACLLIYRESVAANVKDGLRICGDILIPSMFPLMALSAFAVNSGAFGMLDRIFSPVMNKVFALPGICFAAVFFGFTGGYPVGAKIITELYENGSISKNDARRLFAFCINAGPAFVVSAAGGAMLNSVKAGYIMLIALLLSSCIIGVAVSLFAKRKNIKQFSHKKTSSFAESLTSAVSSATSGTLSVCAWVLIFSALTGIVEPNIKNETAKTIFEIVSEVTTGIGSAARLGGLPLAAAATSFGGICVMCQIFPMIKKCGIKVSEYLFFRTINAVSVYFITRILLKFTDAAITVSGVFHADLYVHSAPASAALLLMGAVLILSVRENMQDSSAQLSSI